MNFYELCCRMEADSMNEEWSWKKFAQSAALTGAAGAAVIGGVGASLGGKESSKSPTALTRPADDKYKQIDKYKQRLNSLRARRLDRPEPEPKPEPEPTPGRPELSPEKVTPNFNWGEFMSKDGSPIPKEYKANILELAKNLEVLRSVVGRPISLTSGLRSPEHNANVGGKKNSQHLLGKAADIRIKGMSPTEVHKLIEKLIAEGKMTQGGLGLYVNERFVHYDIRGKKVRW